MYGQSDVSEDTQALTPTLPAACTAACTSEPENANAGTLDADQGSKSEGTDQDQGDPLAAIAAALVNLSPADRARLAAMLGGINR